MARPKTGFDFASIPTDIMNAPKIRRLKRRAPLVGWAVYTALYYKILRYNGYYIEITDDIILDVAEEHGIEEAEVLKGLEACVSVGLFDVSKYDKYQVLTSAEIQQYVTGISAKCNRVAPKFLSHLCLIANNSSEECADSSEECADSSEECADSSGFVTRNSNSNSNSNSNVDDDSARMRADINDSSAIFKHTEDENIHIADLCERLKAESVWVEALCMNLHKDRNYILQRLDEFCTEQQMQGVTTKPLQDAKKHFRYWLNKVEQIATEQGQAQAKPTAAPTKGRPKFYVYEEMLTEANRRGTTTDAFAPIRIDGQEKPLWVSIADKRAYNIPDKIAGMPQISTKTA